MSDVPYVGLCGCKSFLLPCYSASHPISSLQTSSLEYSSLFPVSLFSFLCPDDRPNTFLPGYLSIFTFAMKIQEISVFRNAQITWSIMFDWVKLQRHICRMLSFPLLSHDWLDQFMDKQMSRCLVIIYFLVLSQWDLSERTIFRKVQFNINMKTIFLNIFLYNHIC